MNFENGKITLRGPLEQWHNAFGGPRNAFGRPHLALIIRNRHDFLHGQNVPVMAATTAT